MSRSAFARDFKATLGVTPMEFVTRIRLNLARRLLASSVRPVEAIAAEVGFTVVSPIWALPAASPDV